MSLENGLRPNFLLERLAPHLDKLVVINEEPGFREDYAGILAENMGLIVYQNHQGHGDGWVLSLVVRHLRSLALELTGTTIPGFIMPFAASIESGHQGKLMQISHKLLTPVYRQRGLWPLPYTREKDEKQYSMSRTRVVTFRETRRMAEKVKSGFWVGYFPEGSVEGGRHKNGSGEINGMIEVTEGSLFSFHNLVERVTGREAAFLPIAAHGSFRFFSADNKLPTRQFIRGILGGRVLPVEAMIKRPITTSILTNELGNNWRKDNSNLIDFAMRQLALALPEEARGVYNRDLQVVG